MPGNTHTKFFNIVHADKQDWGQAGSTEDQGITYVSRYFFITDVCYKKLPFQKKKHVH